MRTARVPSLLVGLAVLLAACTADDADDAAAADDSTELAVAVASYDVAVGDDQRLMAGVFTPQRELLAFGEVTFRLGFLGDDDEAEVTQEATAGFLPVPGMEPEAEATQPTLLTDTDGNGVYAARVDLDQPGIWGLSVEAELADGTTRQGTVRFNVAEAPQVVTVGDEAPRTENHTIADVENGSVAPVALDSRAQDPDSDIPDPHLHQTTIAESIEQGRPVVAVFSTPVYCASRFCGPLTNVVADLAVQYEDRADFVMVEVWQDFEAGQLNDAAAEWIQTPEGGNEPWVFLINDEGAISARWDNVLDVDELEQHLEDLPAIIGDEDDD